MSDRECSDRGICANGSLIASAAATQADHCASCDSGYHLVGKACVAWDGSCANGALATQASRTSDHHCGLCYNGYHLVGKVCSLKVCHCPNGVAATGAACPKHGDPQCTACTGAFHLTNANAQCDTNICSCLHGQVATGAGCPVHGAAMCVTGTCHDGHHMEGNNCVVTPWETKAGIVTLTVTGGDWVTVNCPANTYIVGGGCEATNGDNRFVQNGPGGKDVGGTPSNTAWTCGGRGAAKKVTIICSKFVTSVEEHPSMNDYDDFGCNDPSMQMLGGGCKVNGDVGFSSSRPFGNADRWQCGGHGEAKWTRVICASQADIKMHVTTKTGGADWQDVACASSQKLIGGGCIVQPFVDTVGWSNGHGHDCASYASQWCSGSGFVAGKEWTGGATFNFPEKNCAACRTEALYIQASMPAAVTVTGSGLAATANAWQCGGHGAQKDVYAMCALAP
jgi:hypothetical protein